MTLDTGHPDVRIPGHADGDADCPEFGLRGFLAKHFALPAEVVEEPNGSEFILLDNKRALFGLYWDGMASDPSAFFKLIGEVHHHRDGFDYFHAEPDGITTITSQEFDRLLRD